MRFYWLLPEVIQERSPEGPAGSTVNSDIYFLSIHSLGFLQSLYFFIFFKKQQQQKKEKENKLAGASSFNDNYVLCHSLSWFETNDGRKKKKSIRGQKVMFQIQNG